MGRASTPEHVNPGRSTCSGSDPTRLDITDQASIEAAASGIASDVTLLINNAGIATGASLLDGDLQQVSIWRWTLRISARWR